MIVCVCNRLTESDVRHAARCGAANPEDAYACHDGEVMCGCCLDYAQEVIDDEHRSCAGGTAISAVVASPHLRLVSSKAA